MKTGSIVTWKEPLEENEISQKFVVLEDRDDRVLVTDVAVQHLPFPPTHVYMKTDLKEIK